MGLIKKLIKMSRYFYLILGILNFIAGFIFKEDMNFYFILANIFVCTSVILNTLNDIKDDIQRTKS